MRNLIILRGAPGAGKSTWVEKNHLKPFTLCADDLRTLVQTPVPSLKPYTYEISQRNDNYVWDLLFELLEKRMEKGELVIIDATHSKSSDFSKYNKLCQKYRYRRYFVNFTDVPVEVCKQRNLNRPVYKQVPESVIDKMYARFKTQEKTSGWVELEKENILSQIEPKCFDLNEYKHIYLFGDIHSVIEPLENFFKNQPFDKNNFYIFCGDYFDRGKNPREVAKLLIKLSKEKNVLFLQGNHERYAIDWLNKETGNLSSSFKHGTLPFIEDLPGLPDFIRKFGQMGYFEFDGTKYFATHGGLTFMPSKQPFTNVPLCTIATDNFVKGVGSYEDDIDTLWKDSFKYEIDIYDGQKKTSNKSEMNIEPIVQVHGHRNIFGTDGNELSYNLEGNIEFGGHLKVLKLTHGRKPTLLKYKNDSYCAEPDFKKGPTHNEELDMVKQLRESSDISEKDLGDATGIPIHSFNFKRNVFFKAAWNKLNTKARGLFINMNDNSIVARSYDKFFNLEERRETEMLSIIRNHKNTPYTAYRKENGYLGLVTLINNELHFFTKSTDTGEYAEWFKNIWNNLRINEDFIKEYLKENNATLVFEVIDPDNDPHIIEYKKPNLILLDIVHNTWEFKKESYENLCDFAKKANLSVKQVYRVFANEIEFLNWHKTIGNPDNLTQKDIEGIVVEIGDETKPFMFKIKFGYYRVWKQLRGLVYSVAKGRNVELKNLWSETHNLFYAWLKTQPPEKLLNSDIISLRKEFEKS